LPLKIKFHFMQNIPEFDGPSSGIIVSKFQNHNTDLTLGDSLELSMGLLKEERGLLMNGVVAAVLSTTWRIKY
jgi:hypothetical protein